jgi:hypothetical protein
MLHFQILFTGLISGDIIGYFMLAGDGFAGEPF